MGSSGCVQGAVPSHSFQVNSMHQWINTLLCRPSESLSEGPFVQGPGLEFSLCVYLFPCLMLSARCSFTVAMQDPGQTHTQH